MRTRIRTIRLLAGSLVLASFLFGCGKQLPSGPATVRATRHTVLQPAPPALEDDGLALVDATHTDEGYVQVRYAGEAEKAKVQITAPDGTVYTYTLSPGAFAVLPLTGGSGSYTVNVLEHAFDNAYALVSAASLEVEITDEFRPFLYPNQYVWYGADSRVHTLARELSDLSANDLDYVDRVYTYVVEHIAYDEALAGSVTTGYLPDPDRTLETGTGICLDFASLMTALLRSQGIPTKLVVGYSGQTYHAWISVYLEDIGWVDGTIYFDGTTWARMDPTLAAGNPGVSVADYVNNSGNYLEKYFY